MVNRMKSALVAGTLCLALAACGKAETPPEVRQDVAEAKAEGAVDVAIAQAEAEHKVEIERCEALTGGERQVCKDQADAALTAARDAARGITEPTQSQ